ncbi:hypothetical protein HHK36_028083 [Tetracentron sinense]|uniref:Phytocyanin domain-containing protein n=1 Tax=Tetracentron sinense TaxID=13715 RepID=A0A834YKD9_TETSI|nr:hypothetical protein HHK36_028083 [Tetracentron sinense]
MAMATALLILLFVAPAVHAKDITVGGNSGWDTGFNYVNWAATQTFSVGDRLVFTYGGSHSVDLVSKSDYDTCATSNVMASYSDGNTTITLNSTGSIYFLCPKSGHCGQGMKLAILVTASNTPSTTTSSPPPPKSPTTNTATNTTSPPPPSGATGSFYNLNILVVLASIVLAPALVVMG